MSGAVSRRASPRRTHLDESCAARAPARRGHRAPRVFLPPAGVQARARQRKGRYAVAQTKADRQAAAKKGAATRKRNEQRASSQAGGKKAAATRQGKAASGAASDAKSAAKGAVSGLGNAARAAGTAAK